MRLFLLPLTATLLHAASAPAELKPGDTLPEIKGEYLTGKAVALPAAATGRKTLLALGFSYASRIPVEAWIKQFRKDFGPRPDVMFYEVPMIGGMGVMGKWFIDSGMRKGTPKADHEHVITVYGGQVGVWKQRLMPRSDKEACLILIDSQGVVRWRFNGMFDETAYRELTAQMAK